MLKWFIALVVKVFAGKAFDWLGAFVARQESEKAKAEARVAKAENETLAEIGETADAQAQVNAHDRGSASDVARRVRERLAERQAGVDRTEGDHSS